MFGLPPDFDASPFIGCTLELVSFSENTINFSFDRNVSVTVEGFFDHVQGTNVNGEPLSVPVQNSQLMQLTGHSVQMAEGSEDGTLTLVFTNGQQLIVYDDLPMYESYKINIGTTEIIV
ncbi:MAG: DUF6188 family protein [Armatimonadota bacterium]|nr:DUF6188 family protein [Armatimonadota bacterium]